MYIDVIKTEDEIVRTFMSAAVWSDTVPADPVITRPPYNDDRA
jgi:hypothetical protein